MRRFPVIAAGAEYLVMGHLMRRNVLTYQAPRQNEGYDLICTHPDPRHQPVAQLRVQVKSRYASDCGHSFPVKQQTLDAFDFLVVAFLNVGYFYRRRGRGGPSQPEFYTLPVEFVREHLDVTSSWEKVHLKPLRDEAGFDQIARLLGIPPPTETFV